MLPSGHSIIHSCKNMPERLSHYVRSLAQPISAKTFRLVDACVNGRLLHAYHRILGGRYGMGLAA